MKFDEFIKTLFKIREKQLKRNIKKVNFITLQERIKYKILEHTFKQKLKLYRLAFTLVSIVIIVAGIWLSLYHYLFLISIILFFV